VIPALVSKVVLIPSGKIQTEAIILYVLHAILVVYHVIRPMTLSVVLPVMKIMIIIYQELRV